MHQLFQDLFYLGIMPYPRYRLSMYEWIPPLDVSVAFVNVNGSELQSCGGRSQSVKQNVNSLSSSSVRQLDKHTQKRPPHHSNKSLKTSLHLIVTTRVLLSIWLVKLLATLRRRHSPPFPPFTRCSGVVQVISSNLWIYLRRNEWILFYIADAGSIFLEIPIQFFSSMQISWDIFGSSQVLNPQAIA